MQKINLILVSLILTGLTVSAKDYEREVSLEKLKRVDSNVPEKVARLLEECRDSNAHFPQTFKNGLMKNQEELNRIIPQIKAILDQNSHEAKTKEKIESELNADQKLLDVIKSIREKYKF